MFQSPGAPGYGDNHRPDDWNPDLDEHGQRDGSGEQFEADQITYPVYAQTTSYPSDKLHNYSDLDSSQQAQHHTLGPGHNQSTPGDHTHNGGSSKLLSTGPGANQYSPGNHTHDGGTSLAVPYKNVTGLFALLPQTAAISGTTDASGFLLFNHGFKDINGNPAAPSKIITQVHDVGTPGFGNIDIIDGSINTAQAKAYCVNFNGTARTSATVNFWIECYV